jgi:hypothetical protein
MCSRTLPGIVAAMALSFQTAQAVPRKDVLECVVADGSRFVLTSTYDWFPVPVLRHSSSESRRVSWSPMYFDVHGRRSAVPSSVMYENKVRQTLEEVCAHFGMRDGVPLAPYSYLREDGTWYSVDDFPWQKLNVHLVGPPSEMRDRERALLEAGIKYAPNQFAYIRPAGTRLVFEHPLSHTLVGWLYKVPFDAVYQAFSDDGGRTWSDGQLTDNALIFEMGRGWVEQSFRARPVRLNGKPFELLKD